MIKKYKCLPIRSLEIPLYFCQTLIDRKEIVFVPFQSSYASGELKYQNCMSCLHSRDLLSKIFSVGSFISILLHWINTTTTSHDSEHENIIKKCIIHSFSLQPLSSRFDV